MEMKKIKLWKKILIMALIVLAVLSILIIRKFIIITNLVNKAKEYDNKTNYLAVVQSLQQGNMNMLKSYRKGGDYLTTIKIYGKNIPGERGLVLYKKGAERIDIIQSENEKIAILNDENILGGEINVANTFSSIDNTITKMQFVMMSRITTDKYQDTECYFIELGSWKMWVNKETGLVIREINGGIVSERSYEFDVVKDEDIVKPDTSDCKIQ